MDQHDHNEKVWWERQGIDPLDVARKLYAVSGNTEAAVMIIKQAFRKSGDVIDTSTGERTRAVE